MNQARLLGYLVEVLDAGMLRISGDEIDGWYVDDWARRLGLTEIWEAARRRAEE